MCRMSRNSVLSTLKINTLQKDIQSTFLCLNGAKNVNEHDQNKVDCNGICWSKLKIVFMNFQAPKLIICNKMVNYVKM